MELQFKIGVRISVEQYIWKLLQPHSPDNRALARECKDVKIDRVYIGSCTGGKTEDFLAAAKVFLASVRHHISTCSFFGIASEFSLFHAEPSISTSLHFYNNHCTLIETETCFVISFWQISPSKTILCF